jgi:hypothetical protein
MLNYIEVLKNMPAGWLSTTTHRLDIYDEKLANAILDQFEALYNDNNSESSALNALPTAYDYIHRDILYHVLEWSIAKVNNLKAESVISFESKSPCFGSAKKKLDNRNTQILYTGELPDFFDADNKKYLRLSF